MHQEKCMVHDGDPDRRIQVGGRVCGSRCAETGLDVKVETRSHPCGGSQLPLQVCGGRVRLDCTRRARVHAHAFARAHASGSGTGTGTSSGTGTGTGSGRHRLHSRCSSTFGAQKSQCCSVCASKDEVGYCLFVRVSNSGLVSGPSVVAVFVYLHLSQGKGQ